MIFNMIFFVIMWAVAAFMANRLYVIIRDKAITVKGVTYSKSGTPIMYWVEMFIIVFGLLFIGGIAVLLTLGYVGMIG